MAKKQCSNRFIDVLLSEKGIITPKVSKEKETLTKDSFIPGVVFTDGTNVLTLQQDGSEYYIEDLKSDQTLHISGIDDLQASVCNLMFGCLLSGLLIYSEYDVISKPNA